MLFLLGRMLIVLKKNRRHIVFVSYNRFPDGDAGAIREVEMSKAFPIDLFEISFISMGDFDRNEWLHKPEYNHISLSNSSKTTLEKIKNRFTYSDSLMKALKYCNERNKIDSLIVYSIPIKTWKIVKRYSKENSITLYHNSTEWYSPCEFKQGRFSRQYIFNDYLNKHIIDKEIKVIAVSKFLNEHFLDKGIRSLFIPPLVNMESVKFDKRFDEKLNFMYAGLPSGKGKEDLKHILQAFSLLSDDELEKVTLTIIGINRQQLIDAFDVSENTLSRLEGMLDVRGRVPRIEVLKAYEKCSYTVLLRSDTERYAKASFPSKFVESFAYGTAVISNYTCNIEDYVENGINGYIVDKNDPVLLANTLRVAIRNEISKEELCKNSCKTAMEHFDVKVYKKVLEAYFNE